MKKKSQSRSKNAIKKGKKKQRMEAICECIKVNTHGKLKYFLSSAILYSKASQHNT